MPVRLPVVDDGLAHRPVTRGDCASVPRPCPWISCRCNLIADVLEDGSITLNYRSKRLQGAERAIPPKHDPDQNWFVIVRAKHGAKSGAVLYALGPCNDAPRAKAVAAAYQAEFGEGTAMVSRQIPDWAERAIVPLEGIIDARFADEVEDAIEEWFDEPDPSRWSCVLDKVEDMALREGKKPGGDDGDLLEEIAQIMYVSRERVRQVEVAGLLKLRREGGLTTHDVLDED